MKLRTCDRQAEVIAMQADGHWSHACPPELRAHLDACRSCSEVLVVNEAFRQERADAIAQPQLPAAGAIWWRAQLRRRHAAIEQMGRPVLGAYLFALALTVLAAVGVAVSQAHHGLRWLDMVAQAQGGDARSQTWNTFTAMNPGSGLMVVIPICAMLVLVGVLVVYLAADRS